MPYDNVFVQDRARELPQRNQEKKPAVAAMDTARETLTRKQTLLDRLRGSGDNDPSITSMVASLQNEVVGLTQKLKGFEDTAQTLGPEGVALQLKNKEYDLEKNQVQRATPELVARADKLKQEIADLRGMESYLKTLPVSGGEMAPDLPARVNQAMQPPADFK